MGLTDKTLDRFDSRERELDDFTFAGIEIKTLPDGFLLHQRKQIDKITVLPLDATFSNFKFVRMSLAWITHTRPEICCAVAQCAQVTATLFDASHIKQLNSTIRSLKRDPARGIRHRKLDKDTLRVKVYTDSSFANNHECSSQLGHIIVLSDATGKCNVLQYRSHKSRRVTRSVLGAEVYAFAEGFDNAYMIRHDLKQLLQRPIPLSMFTNSKSLFDVLVKNSYTTERRLIIDL